jgi:hypothetical protein
MAPEPRFVPRFAAEPPQEGLPYGRWAQTLEDRLRAAWTEMDTDGENVGEPGEISWFPDRSWHGWTYVPGSARTSEGYEVFGFVRFERGRDDGQPSGFSAHGDFTAEVADANPGWQLDVCEEVIGSWRGKGGATASMTLVWGVPLLGRGAIATAELAGVTVDQCELVEQRFTLIAPDDYQHDLLEVALWGATGQELARESLYEEERDGEQEDGERDQEGQPG